MDAFATGALLAPAFRELGYGLIHLQTSNQMAKSLMRTFVPTDFDHCVDYESCGTERTLGILRSLPIVCVLPGCDSGVILADEIAESLGVARNSAGTTLARRSKFFMHEALRADGLLAARQIKSAKLEEVLIWYSAQDLRKVVVKPEYAARSEGVSFCESENDVIRAFEMTVGTTNLFGIVNAELVVQEYLYGAEYMVNTMSVNGEHFVTDVWVGVDDDEEEISADLYAELLHPEDEHFAALSEYVKQVLTCVGIDTGPAHVEVRWTPGGAALIEIGARLAGAMSSKAFRHATGFDPVQLTVDAYVRPDRALQALLLGGQSRCARLVFFHSDLGGLVHREPDLSEMYSLESVLDVLVMVRAGDLMQKTDDMSGRPGYAYLVHETQSRLDEDYRRFRILENHLYRAMLGG